MTDTSATFTLSAFGDEIADDVDAQLAVLGELDIGWLELRKAWGNNVLQLDDGQVAELDLVVDLLATVGVRKQLGRKVRRQGFHAAD